jgi:hypothetical protein
VVVLDVARRRLRLAERGGGPSRGRREPAAVTRPHWSNEGEPKLALNPAPFTRRSG